MIKRSITHRGKDDLLDVTFENGSSQRMPDRQLDLVGGRLPSPGYALDATRGFAHSLVILTREGRAIGWIMCEKLGFPDVKCWLKGGAPGRAGELQANSSSPRRSLAGRSPARARAHMETVTRRFSPIAKGPVKSAVAKAFLKSAHGWAVAEDPGGDWLIAYKLSWVQGQSEGERILFRRIMPDGLWVAFRRGNVRGAERGVGYGYHGAIEWRPPSYAIADWPRGGPMTRRYCKAILSAPDSLVRRFHGLRTAQAECTAGLPSPRRGR